MRYLANCEQLILSELDWLEDSIYILDSAISECITSKLVILPYLSILDRGLGFMLPTSQIVRKLDFSMFQRFTLTLTYVSRLWCPHHSSTIKNQRICSILSRLIWLDSWPRHFDVLRVRINWSTFRVDVSSECHLLGTSSKPRDWNHLERSQDRMVDILTSFYLNLDAWVALLPEQDCSTTLESKEWKWTQTRALKGLSWWLAGPKLERHLTLPYFIRFGPMAWKEFLAQYWTLFETK